MTAVLNELAFRSYVFRRMAHILFKKRKKIKLLHFSYVADADSNDTLILRYKFVNSVYFTFDGKKTMQNRMVVMRPEIEKKVSLTVHGFFRKSNYAITVQRDNVYITKLH